MLVVMRRGVCKRPRVAYALTVMAAFLAGCGGSADRTHASVAIKPSDLTVRLGSTKQVSLRGSARVSWGLSESGAPTYVPKYPLAVSANGRYLVDQRGHPWRIQADAAWLMSSDATPEQVDQYLTRRAAQGFDSFYLMAMVHPGGYAEVAPNAPDDQRGNPPFAKPGDFATAGASPASQRYWRWIDSIVDKAEAHHMVVMLAYSYLGWSGGDMGWYQDIVAQPSRQALFDWGVWLGNRFKNDGNIIWFALGDYGPPTGSEGSLRARAIADGIRSTGAVQPFMAEPSPPDQLPRDLPDFAPVLDMNSFYGYGREGRGAVYETADRAWRSSPTTPAWMQEGTYEYENNWGHFSAEPWDTRRGRFWSVLAGGTAGDGFGSKDVWQWQKIPESLSSPGARYSTYAFDLFASMPWWKLEPSGADATHTGVNLIPSGGGQWGELNYITSARTSDHDWLLAYVPVAKNGARTFSVAMSALAGRTRARWFDPATGNYIAISNGYSDANAGERKFTTPGSRSDGTDDWLLVLDSTGKPRCGSITKTGRYTAPTVAPTGVTCEITASRADDSSVVARARVTLKHGA